MRKCRAFSLSELMVATSMMSFVLFGLLGLLMSGLQSYTRSYADMHNTEPTAQAIRRIIETIRPAMSVSVSNNGKTLTFNLPAINNSKDPITGEQEYVTPLTSDAVARSYTISNGSLVEQPGGRVLLTGISSTDPDPTSVTYNQTYQPFVLTPMSTRQAITITLMTSAIADKKLRYSRMQAEVTLQNIR